MQPQHFLPPPALTPYIAFYGIIDVDEDFYEQFCSPPLALCGMHFNLEGTSEARLNGEIFLKDRYCASGQITAPIVGCISGRTKRLLVFIHPCGLYQFFGCNMPTLTNTSVPLSEFLGEEIFQRLMDKLNACDSDDAMVAVMNEFFLSLQPFYSIAPEMAQVLEYIHENRGNVSVRDIETACFITARSLERHFKMYIGLSPKDYMKIYRFKCLVNFISQNPGLSWDNLCEQNGFYDQSHLTRYFSRYMQGKPGDMVHLNNEFMNYLLQDA